MIKLKKNNCKDGFLDKIKNLYEASFPIDERRDFQDIIKLLDDKKSPFEIIAFIEDGEFSGFLSFWKWDDMRYFEHFAVEPSMRNGGRGAKYLCQAIADDSTPVVLEVEPPVDEMARRRIGFYERNGLRLWNDLYYLQPAYGEDRSPLELKLMTAGDITFSGEDDEKILRIKREVYGQNL